MTSDRFLSIHHIKLTDSIWEESNNGKGNQHLLPSSFLVLEIYHFTMIDVL